jgi:putative membrane protein
MKAKILILLHSTVLIVLFSGCTQHPMDGSARGWGHMMGYGGYGGMFMWLILILIAGVVVYFVFNRSKRNTNPAGSTRESPTEILKRRYAAGDISKEEFDRLKKEIES